jgi:hypothetical protein
MEIFMDNKEQRYIALQLAVEMAKTTDVFINADQVVRDAEKYLSFLTHH